MNECDDIHSSTLRGCPYSTHSTISMYPSFSCHGVILYVREANQSRSRSGSHLSIHRSDLPLSPDDDAYIHSIQRPLTGAAHRHSLAGIVGDNHYHHRREGTQNLPPADCPSIHCGWGRPRKSWGSRLLPSPDGRLGPGASDPGIRVYGYMVIHHESWATIQLKLFLTL